MPMEECLQYIFVKATNYVKSSTDKLDSTRLLYLYARYKQVKLSLKFPFAVIFIKYRTTVGDNISNLLVKYAL